MYDAPINHDNMPHTKAYNTYKKVNYCKCSRVYCQKLERGCSE